MARRIGGEMFGVMLHSIDLLWSFCICYFGILRFLDGRMCNFVIFVRTQYAMVLEMRKGRQHRERDPKETITKHHTKKNRSKISPKITTSKSTLHFCSIITPLK